MAEALVGFAAFLALAFLRVPLWISMILVGTLGFTWKVSLPAALSMIGQIAYETSMSYALSVVPLFVLMGNLVTRARLSEELYDAAYAFFGHLRGGLALSTIVACAGFSSICGSSLATAATMGKVAYPSMKRFGYKDTLAAGCIAAGGTLGILIPPSVLLVIYGILTEQNIGQLFAAGILPGVVATLCYLGAVLYVVRRDPQAGPPGERQGWPQRLRALSHVWGVLLLFGLVMGGLYGGVATPTECAGVGAGGAFLFALFRHGLSWRILVQILVESARTTAMIFAILIGAMIFSNFVNLTGMPAALRDFVGGSGFSPLMVIVAILVVYVLLGCVLESLSMILLTVPLFYPLVQHLGFDLIWFGILVVCVTELSLITPPVGLNVFVLRGVLPAVSITAIYRGVTPFVVADIVRLAILVAFPAISLYLPSLMK
ncbi:MAG: TRAP transporter large permease [Burkholderiales bacterium]|nr:TRAP transporter large permease [Burkholderiales bacterium]